MKRIAIILAKIALALCAQAQPQKALRYYGTLYDSTNVRGSFFGDIYDANGLPFVSGIWRKPGTDSIFQRLNGAWVFAIRDSVGSGGGGSVSWGGITGSLSSQTDLQNALNAKQNTLVSGTNIKTVNGNSLLGPGNITISGGGGSQDLASVLALGNDAGSQAINSLTAINGIAIPLVGVTFATDVNGVQPNANGRVNIAKADLGLGNVDNTSDAAKPISTATQTALNAKQNTLSGAGLVKSTSGTITYVADNSSNWNNAVLSTGSYGNPTWLTSLAWSKISSTPTTLSGYGITDATAAARSAISLAFTTSGTSGSATGTYNNSTGVLTINVPQYSAGGGGSSYTFSSPLSESAGTVSIADGTIGNAKLTNSVVSIAGNSVALGASVTQDQLTGLSATGIVKRTAANSLAIAMPGADYLTTNQTITMTGDVTGSGATGIATTIASNSVSGAKFRQSAALSVVGNSSNATANVADIVAGTDGHVLRRSGTALSFGTLAAGAFAANTVSRAALENGSPLSVVGRSANSAGTVADISATAGTGAVLRESGGSVSWGAIATAGIGNNQVTWDKLQAMSSGRLLGRYTGGMGRVEEVTMGSNMSISAGALTYDVSAAETLTNKTIDGDNNTLQDVPFGALKAGGIVEHMVIAISDETTALTTGLAKATFRMPYAATITGVRASVNTASSSGVPTFNIKENGSSILSTKLTIDANERTSLTAAAAAVISDSAIADDAEMTIDIDVAGTGTKGAKIIIYYTR